jgi:hypothetical protein
MDNETVTVRAENGVERRAVQGWSASQNIMPFATIFNVFNLMTAP